MNSSAARLCASLLLAVAFPVSGFGAFLQEGADGLVSINASSSLSLSPQSGHSWVQAMPAGHQGAWALQALPNNGTNVKVGFVAQSPRADYQVSFERTGVHYVWIRGLGASSKDDSLHVGLDGVGQSSGSGITMFGPEFAWSNEIWKSETMDTVVATIDVPSVGLHTLNVWMREDGFVYDKIVLTTNSGYTPYDSVPTEPGPPESSQGVPSLPAPSITPNGGTFANSVNVSLGSVDPAATIYFTTDGTDPRSSSSVQSFSVPFQLFADATVRAYASGAGYLDSVESSASFTITAGGGPTAFLQDEGPDGIVSINASSALSKVEQGGFAWTEILPAGHVGEWALQAQPNIGVNINSDFENQTPRVDFSVDFNRTGIHFVWIRGLGASGKDDSLHVGLDGLPQDSSDRISDFTSSFGWSNSTMDTVVATIDVQSEGLHTVNVWMREDGMVFDKLVLTSSMAFEPVGTGPIESPQGTPTLPAPSISPNGGSFEGSVTVALDSGESTAAIVFTTDGTDPKISGTAQTYLSPIVLNSDATVRSYATASGYLESDETSASFVITEAAPPMAFLQDGGADGLVSVNASSYANRTSNSGHSWDDAFPVGYLGLHALSAQPNTGLNIKTGFETLSPRVDFEVHFNKTGLHFIWVRGIGASGRDDSLHVGLDGAAQEASARISQFSPSFGWSNETMEGWTAAIDVPTTGLHTINVWMREDGMVFDKIVLTTNPEYDPGSGSGPVQSAQGVPALAAPMINPGGGIFEGVQSVMLSAVTPDAAIVYTTDGSDPRSSGTAISYTAPFDISTSTTVNAAALGPDYLDSEVATKTFTQTSCDVKRIMPLGDSITEGVFGSIASGPGISARGGYRSPLYRSLVDNGYAVQFEGSQSSGFTLVPQIDADHEGRSGWSDDEIAANVYQFLVNNPVDVILLHIGTNDFETSVEDINDILDEVDRYEADAGLPVTVVLAKIINRKTYHAPTTTFNANLQTLYLNRLAAGDQVVLVDQESALNYSADMFDNLHPNADGYGKMGTTWFTELQSQIPVCGS